MLPFILPIIMGFIFYSQPVPVRAESDDEASLSIAKKLISNIKADETNYSFRSMMGKIMEEHALSRHGRNQPYFYSDDAYVITDIVNLVLDDPEGIIDETADTGILKIYRECDYPGEIEELFDREKRAPRKFQNAYLGQTITGPTNKVMVVLKIKGDEQNEGSLEKRLTYMRNNVQYFDAYPVKEGSLELGSAENNPEENKPEENKPEENNPEENKETAPENKATDEGTTDNTETAPENKATDEGTTDNTETAPENKVTDESTAENTETT